MNTKLRAPITTIALRQITTNFSRVAAIVLAVAIGTAFVSASFIYTDSVNQTISRSMTNGVADVDLVLTLPESVPMLQAQTAVNDVPGVTEAFTPDGAYGYVPLGAGQASAGIAPILTQPEIVEGRTPGAKNEVVIGEQSAARVGLGVGDTIVFTPPAEGATSTDLQIVGVVSLRGESSNALALAADPQTVNALSESAYMLMVTTSAESDPQTVSAALVEAFPGSTVQTGAQYAEELVRSSSDSVDELLSALLIFAAIAIFVLALVVRTTFSVLVAQRSRQLALLRCIGASTAQLRQLTLIEAAVIGVVASVLGVGLGIGLMALALTLLGGGSASEFIPESLSISMPAIVVPIAVGVVVTLLGALGPARQAGRLHPLLALDHTTSAERTNAVRRRTIGFGVGAFILGTAAMLVGILVNPLLAVGGGMISALGVLALSGALVPALATLLGRTFSALGAPGRLAAGNAVRNPGRTAATSGALIVGVGLITMMSVGATTMQASSDVELKEQWPVDVTVSAQGQGLDPDLVSALGDTDDLDSKATIPTVAGTTMVDGQKLPISVLSADADALAMLPPAQRPSAGTAVIDNWMASSLGVGTGDKVQLQVGNTMISTTVELVSYEFGLLPDPPILFVASDVSAVMTDSTPGVIWMIATDEDTASDLAVHVNEEVGPRSDVAVASDAAQRGSVQDAIDGVLLVSSALVGIAVLIAVVGVGNTLSLSIFERRREIGMLRAIGMTRRSVRTMVNAESILIAAVGAVIGLVIGVGYGWAGAHALLSGSTMAVQLSIPWGRAALVVGLTLLAALAAAALPARTAARLAPTTALAAT